MSNTQRAQKITKLMLSRCLTKNIDKLFYTRCMASNNASRKDLLIDKLVINFDLSYDRYCNATLISFYFITLITVNHMFINYFDFDKVVNLRSIFHSKYYNSTLRSSNWKNPYIQTCIQLSLGLNLIA